MADKEWVKCPKCGFEGLVNTIRRLRSNEKKHICPECHHQWNS